MKRVTLLYLFIFMMLNSSASNLVIGVVVPERQGNIDAPAFKMLGTRIQQLMTSIGCSSMQRSGLIVYPVVNIINEELIEGGLKNFYRQEFEVTLFIYHVDTNTHFGNYSYSVKGSGSSYSDASKNAFSKISSTDSDFSNFMDLTKQKIYTFFESYRSELMNKAEALSQMKQYEEALSILYSYPKGIAGSDEVYSLMVKVFKLYQSSNCSQMLQQSRSYIAQNNYELALSILSEIDAISPCSSEAKKMIDEIDKKIDKEIAETYKREEQAQDRKERKQKMVVNAIKDVVTAYCNRTQPSISYQNIFR